MLKEGEYTEAEVRDVLALRFGLIRKLRRPGGTGKERGLIVAIERHPDILRAMERYGLTWQNPPPGQTWQGESPDAID